MTQTTTPEIKVAARIAALLADGKPMPEAFDTVLGAGSYAALASDLYDALRATVEGR